MNSSTFEDGSLYVDSVVRRDYTATVISALENGQKRLFVNGVAITHKTPITKMMAHLPLALREGKADDTLVICFGMGTTLRSMASWGVRTTAVELVPSVKDAFGYYFDDAEEVLARPNVDVVIDDGRRFLKRTSRKFDVVTVDPPPPVETAGSSLLYSLEFYELLKTRMSEDGILAQWFPGGEHAILQGVTAALVEAFPYVSVYSSFEGWGFHFLASMKPLPKRSSQEIMGFLPEAARADLMEWVPEKQLIRLFQETLRRRIQPEHILLTNADAWISDDRPLNEYYLLRRRKAAMNE
jgi:spermidine synthase